MNYFQSIFEFNSLSPSNVPNVYLVGPRYKFDLEAPNLVFFKKGSNQTLRYLGPENEQDLLSFVKEQIYGEDTSIKV